MNFLLFYVQNGLIITSNWHILGTKKFRLIFIRIIRYDPPQVCRHKIHSCVVGLLVGFLTSSPTHADFYINSKTGIAITENITNSADINSTFHIGMTLGGSVGYKFPDIFRLEAESTYRRARVRTITNKVSNRSISSDGHIASVSFLGNGFLDIPIYQKLFGSIGGGLGFSKIHVKIPTNAGINTGAKDDDSTFCYQANAGLGYKWLDYLEPSLNYGYFKTLKSSFQDFNGARWNASNGRTHDVIIQVRYFF